MRERCTKTKKNVQGSTLIEVIVALAIVVIAMGIMSTAVNASAKIIDRSKEYSNSSVTSLNGIINGEGNENIYEDVPFDISYTLGGVSINPKGVILKVTNSNVVLLSFVPNEDTPDDTGSHYIPGTTVTVDIIHPEYEIAGNHEKLHYINGTTIMYNDIYYYVNKNININEYDPDSDPYEVISNNIDSLITFTGVNHAWSFESAQIGDTFNIGDKYYIITCIYPNYKYSEIV